MIKTGCSFAWENLPEGLLVRVSGEIDHHGAVGLRRGIDTLIWERSPRKLILDMSGVTLMDSSGLGFIMGRYKLMKETGGETCVKNPSPCVFRILKLTGFDSKVRILRTTSNEKKKGVI